MQIFSCFTTKHIQIILIECKKKTFHHLLNYKTISSVWNDKIPLNNKSTKFSQIKTLNILPIENTQLLADKHLDNTPKQTFQNHTVVAE